MPWWSRRHLNDDNGTVRIGRDPRRFAPFLIWGIIFGLILQLSC